MDLEAARKESRYQSVVGKEWGAYVVPQLSQKYSWWGVGIMTSRSDMQMVQSARLYKVPEPCVNLALKAGPMPSDSVTGAREARARNHNMIQLMGRLKEELGAVPVPTCNLGII